MLIVISDKKHRRSKLQSDGVDACIYCCVGYASFKKRDNNKAARPY